MNLKLFFYFSIFILLCALLISSQTTQVFAQGACFDASGVPCTPTSAEAEKEITKTFTPVPITFIFTATSTNTFTPTATSTPTNTATSTFTATASITPTVTPIPVSQVILPGAGIGALILFLIVGVLFPII